MKSAKTRWLAVYLSLAFVLAAGVSPAGEQERYEEKFERTETLSVDGQVYLRNISGDIEVRISKDNSVRIDALKVSRASTQARARENAGLVTIEVSKEGSSLRIATKYPERRRSWGNDSLNVSVSYKLWIPGKASLEVSSVSGDITIDPLGGKCSVTSTSGDVEVRGAAGVDADVTSGELKVRDIGGDAYLKTISGDIRAEKIRGSVESETVNGDIDLLDVSEAGRVEGKTISGDITYQGEIRPQGQYRLRAHSGDIEMLVPANAGFDLEAKTFSGSIDSDFEIKVVGKISQREVKGQVGSGEATVRLATFSGNIDLRKR